LKEGSLKNKSPKSFAPSASQMPNTDRVNVQTENLKSAPISICSLV
jgi:hypothetical protein